MAFEKSIGIKLYNDTFVPVVKSVDFDINKQLVLTTVRNNQKKAIIELYEGTDEKCINNEFLGKLVINIDRETSKGDPAIKVNLRLDNDGILYAKAWDTESNEQSTIQIEHTATKTILHDTFDQTEINQDINVTQINDYEKPEEKKKGNILKILIPIIILAVVLIIIGLFTAGLIFGIIPKPKIENPVHIITNIINKNKKDKDDDKKEDIIEDTNEDIEDINEDIVEDDTEDIAEDKNDDEPTGTRNTEGKEYLIRWGDNLWNICKKEYDDPWYYPSLAEYNGIEIKKARYIYAGDKLIIPTKSKLRRWPFE